MKLDIVISCVTFERRLCYMLSSIAQQVNPPDLTVDIAYLSNLGSPTTKSVCNTFSKVLNIRETICTPEEMPYRGIVRNRQLKDSKADWILFADTDMVYHPSFFGDIQTKLENDLKNETRCISASRISLDKDFCVDYFSKNVERYPCIIPNVFDEVSKFKINNGHGRGVGKDGVTRNVGAGYFQLANIENLRKNHEGLYWKPTNRRDPNWGYKSDRQFRHMVGGTFPIQTLPQYHLNHERDSDAGVHVESQR